jgi:hypothetical protein
MARGIKPPPQSLDEVKSEALKKRQRATEALSAEDLPTDPSRLDDSITEGKQLKQQKREVESLSLRKAAESKEQAAEFEQPMLLMVRLQLPETAARNRVLARGFADNGLAVEPQAKASVSPRDRLEAATQNKPATAPVEQEKTASEKPGEPNPMRGELSKVAASPRSSANGPQNGVDAKDQEARWSDSDAVAWSKVQLENSGDYAVFFLQATPEQLEGLVEVVQRETEAVAEQQVTLLTANNRASAVTLYNNYSEPMSAAKLDELVDLKGDRNAEPQLRRGREVAGERQIAANSRTSSTPYYFSLPTESRWRWLASPVNESDKKRDPDLFLRRLAELPRSGAEKSRGAEEFDKNREESIAYPVLLAVEVVSDRPGSANSAKAAKEESPENSSRTDAKPAAPEPEKPAPEKPDSDKPDTEAQGKKEEPSPPPN